MGGPLRLGGGDANLVQTPSSSSMPLGVVEPSGVHPRILIHGVVLVELRPVGDAEQLRVREVAQVIRRVVLKVG